jgi:hypothetical protein
MWVRSQDKFKLIDIDNIRIADYINLPAPNKDLETFKPTFGWIKLGSYSTKAKALKVLDKIQSAIIRNDNIFQIPQDSEVKINDKTRTKVD